MKQLTSQFQWLKRPDNRSLRLALTYLVIICALCLSFSIFFYVTSTSGLRLSFNSSPEPTKSSNTSHKGLTLNAEGVGSEGAVSVSGAPNINKLNAELDKKVQVVRQNLFKQLALFNICALIVGAGVSYYLARRTLRPIEAAMEAQARFSSDASHELRTPLAALIARSEVVLRKPRLSETEARKVIKTNIEQAQKLVVLAAGLLQLSKTDRISLSKQAVSLQEVASEAMNTVLTKAKAKRISIEETVPHTRVQADRQSLVRVVVILLDNAIKYSPEHSKIHLEGSIKNRVGVLRVRDTGLGVSRADLPHIFERFYRADISRSTDGYGLGLAIAKQIIEQHNGEITVQSNLDKGTIFTIRLPI